MEVIIKYHDSTSFTPEEVVRQAQNNYGKDTYVEVRSDSPAPHDLVYFAIQQIITYRQLALLYDSKFSYKDDLKALRSEVLQDITEILDSVIVDNESKVA